MVIKDPSSIEEGHVFNKPDGFLQIEKNSPNLKSYHLSKMLYDNISNSPTPDKDYVAFPTKLDPKEDRKSIDSDSNGPNLSEFING